MYMCVCIHKYIYVERERESMTFARFGILLKLNRKPKPCLPQLWDRKTIDSTWFCFEQLIRRGIKGDVNGLCNLQVKLEREEWWLWGGGGFMQHKRKATQAAGPKGYSSDRKEVAGLPLPPCWFQPRNSTLAGERRLVGPCWKAPQPFSFLSDTKWTLCFVNAVLFPLSQLICALVSLYRYLLGSHLTDKIHQRQGLS